MYSTLKILFVGDIVGRLGRRAVVSIIPSIKDEYQLDFIVANGENIAHGVGVTQTTVDEVLSSGIDLLTSGNHIFRKASYKDIVEEEDYKVIRPANYPSGVLGYGYKLLKKNNKKIIVTNLMGRIFFRESLDDPFAKLDELLANYKEQYKEDCPPIIVDWHTEATSEKAALAWYSDGRVSAVLGTHTHVMTADEKILPHGTAFISDVGMVGARDSILGVEKDGPINMMRTQIPCQFKYPETGIAKFNAVFLEVDSVSRKTLKIKRIEREVNITG